MNLYLFLQSVPLIILMPLYLAIFYLIYIHILPFINLLDEGGQPSELRETDGVAAVTGWGAAGIPITRQASSPAR